MKKAKTYIALITLAFLYIQLISCKKNEEPVVVQPVQLMKINFTNGFVPNQLEVIVFISDSAGNLITEMACPADGTYELFAPEGMIAPDNMMVTIVKYDFYWHNLLIQINTYTNVSPTEWTVEGTQPKKLGDAVITLANVPAAAKAKVYSAFGYSNYTFSVNPQTCPVYTSPDDFYVKLNTAPDEPMYKWLKGIEAGENYTLDLSDMSLAETKLIQFPLVGDFFKANIWGINNNDFTLALMTDQVIGDGNPADKVVLSYPSETFATYRTNLFLQKSFQEKTAYTYNAVGQIPDAFAPVTTEIVSVSPETGGLTYVSSGNFNTTRAAWYYMSYNNEIFHWSVYAPPTQSTIKLPKISPLVTATFPVFSIDSLNYNNIELIDFLNQNSYFNVLETIFNPASPQHPEELNSSSMMNMPIYN